MIAGCGLSMCFTWARLAKGGHCGDVFGLASAVFSSNSSVIEVDGALGNCEMRFSNVRGYGIGRKAWEVAPNASRILRRYRFEDRWCLVLSRQKGPVAAICGGFFRETLAQQFAVGCYCQYHQQSIKKWIELSFLLDRYSSVGYVSSSSYLTQSKKSPCGGAVGPAVFLSFASKTSEAHSAGCFLRPI